MTNFMSLSKSEEIRRKIVAEMHNKNVRSFPNWS